MCVPSKFLFILASLFLYSQTLFAAPTVDTVYFGQTHVWKTTDPYIALVSERDTLLIVHVVDPSAGAAPVVTATLTGGAGSTDITLTGPGTLPTSIADGLGVVQHDTNPSFKGTIPAAWAMPGLTVEIKFDGVTQFTETPSMGAPNHMVMRMIDVHYFKEASGDYPAGTFDELAAKWPVSSLTLNRFTKVVFPDLVIPARSGKTAIRCTSTADYEAQTGIGFDGEQSAATQWNAAIRDAGGTNRYRLLSYINIYGAPSNGGVAGGFAGVGDGRLNGILHHELGHALSLPHWGDNAGYPYKGAMHGINPPAIYNETHAGPVWAYDLPSSTFIPCTVQANSVGGKPVDTYKADPMQGGGSGFQETGFLFNHFSDYSVNKIRNSIQSNMTIWNTSLSEWTKWNTTDGDYTTVVANDGVKFPLQRNVQVITVMASVSGSTPDVNMVYTPIGPYTANMIRLFDPRVPADRTDAQAIFAPAGGCDVTLRIIQGGTEKYYMLAAAWEPGVDPLTSAALKTRAVNLPATDGEVTYVELLLTPDAEVNGLPGTPNILYTWDLKNLGKITNLNASRMPNGIYLEWENNWEYTSIKLLRNGSVLEAALDPSTTTYLDTTPPASGDVTYTLIPVRTGFEFDSTAVTVNMDTVPIRALIYEPFEDLNSTLTGNAPGTGLIGTWYTRGINKGNSAQGVLPDSMAYGNLTTNAGKTYGTDTGGWPKSSYVGIDPVLNTAGLLDHGAELWFSFLVQNGATSYVDFRLGTHGIYADGQQYQGEAIGVNVDGDLAIATVWNPSPSLSVDNGVIPLAAPVLVVGKITWGADGAAADTVEIYLPDTDLVFPALPVSTTSAVLDQSLFDTLCFRGNLEDAPHLDEIRFGHDYNSVIAAEDHSPTLLSAATATPATINVNDTTTLTVSAEDPFSRALTYGWEMVNGPATATLNTANSATTLASGFTAVGNYEFKVTISNGPKSISSNVTVAVTGSGPIADVALPAGISLYGYTGENPVDAKAAFQGLIDNSQLSVVRWVDPANGQIRELYYTTFPSPAWVNEIGDLTLGQGYLIKTTTTCTLSISGNKSTASVSLDLPVGYSIIGFNKETPMDAQGVFQSLIDAGKLEVVRWVDPSNGMIKELYFTTFPSAGWVNEIGNLIEGQGYIIKLNTAHPGFALP